VHDAQAFFRPIAGDMDDAGLGQVDVGVFAADDPGGPDAQVRLMADQGDVAAAQAAQEAGEFFWFAVGNQVGANMDFRQRRRPGTQHLFRRLPGSQVRTGDDLLERDATAQEGGADGPALRFAALAQGTIFVGGDAAFSQGQRVGVADDVNVQVNLQAVIYSIRLG